MAHQVSIVQVKFDLSELINKVAFGGERIVITSRSTPKAVIVSMSDYEQLTAQCVVCCYSREAGYCPRPAF
jgi:prevent-host-death family protein